MQRYAVIGQRYLFDFPYGQTAIENRAALVEAIGVFCRQNKAGAATGFCFIVIQGETIAVRCML